MSIAYPLLTREPDEIVGWLDEQPVSCAEFLRLVAALAAELPDNPYAINLCRNRMLFLIGFCAVITRGQANLLLPNDGPGSVEQGKQQCGPGQFHVMRDHCSGPGDTNVRTLIERYRRESHSDPTNLPDIPQVPADQRCIATFTSGTTGKPASVFKSWATIRASTAINIRPYLGQDERNWQLLATVPPQHMYGLESSIFFPLLANVTIHPGRPLLPADLVHHLQAMAPPRLLISTPAHLQALVAETIGYPKVERLVSATAPLSQDLARAAAERFQAEVCEIYGCSEAGSLAYRNPIADAHWTLFDGFQADTTARGETHLHATHLPEPVLLNDQLTWTNSTQFRLGQRQGDQVNIAGKRASLEALTQTLINIPGVLDGAVFPVPGAVRLAALVVAPDRQTRDLRLAMRAHVDDTLIPRPIVKVDAMPRNTTGKLPLSALLELYAKQR